MTQRTINNARNATTEELLSPQSRKLFRDNVNDYYKNKREGLIRQIEELSKPLKPGFTANEALDVAAMRKTGVKEAKEQLAELNAKQKRLNIDDYMDNYYEKTVRETVNKTPIQVNPKYLDEEGGRNLMGMYSPGYRDVATGEIKKGNIYLRHGLQRSTGIHEVKHAVQDIVGRDVRMREKGFGKVADKFMQPVYGSTPGTGIDPIDLPMWGSIRHMIPRTNLIKGGTVKNFKSLLNNLEKDGLVLPIGRENNYSKVISALDQIMTEGGNLSKKYGGKDEIKKMIKILSDDAKYYTYLTDPMEISSRVSQFRALSKNMQDLVLKGLYNPVYMRQLRSVFDEKTLHKILKKTFTVGVPLGVAGSAVGMGSDKDKS